MGHKKAPSLQNKDEFSTAGMQLFIEVNHAIYFFAIAIVYSTEGQCSAFGGC